jgi:hypothetical protein
MKCSACQSLNSFADAACAVCGTPLHQGPNITQVPWWGCLFALACGIIPGVSLGGIIPIGLGLGGAAACIKVSSTGAMPKPLRLVLCVAIVGFCWLAFLIFLGLVFQMLLRTRR